MRLLLFLFTTSLITAQELPPVVRASGDGVVSLKPDQATVTIGVVTQATSADAAAAQNATQLTSVLKQLRSTLGSTADIRTSGYSLNPNYKYGNGQSPTITGYTATNTVLVKIEDIARVGAVVDAATRTGANTIHGIEFGVKNEQAGRAEALKLAAQAARANANAIASALGLRVIRVRSAESGQPVHVIPLQREFQARAADVVRAPTPIEPGTLDFRATVTVTLEVAP
jgi:uncharacterized protein